MCRARILGAITDDAGSHILGECRVTFLNRTINSRQSVRCCALALEATESSTLASVGLVLFSAIEIVRDYRFPGA
jgi:hypothetical protein